ncbi:MAG: DNA repair exonuclease [Pirellulales bacterium]|nr:DNA repair exonuclease [Pirellulales bacterium]
MRLLHTADWQIGMRAKHVGPRAERVRAERLAAARRAIDAANGQAVDFVLVAGDTFEDNAVDRVLVQQVADVLAGFAGPVYLIPGNHDPAEAGSVWDHPAWAAHANLHVLARPEPVDVPGGVLYPCPLHAKHSMDDPTRWIDATGEARIAIGLAHGHLEGIPQDQPEHPIARDAATRAGLDYLALGHWHSFKQMDTRTVYSGTHEPTGFGERDSGNVLVVEIDRRGATPRIEPIHTGGLEWLSWQESIREAGELAQVRQRIEKIVDHERTLLEIVLSGVFPAADRGELARIEELVAARFVAGRVDATALRLAPEDGAWAEALGAGPLREAARRLAEWADPDFAGPRPEGATPEVAQRARLELFALLDEGPQ